MRPLKRSPQYAAIRQRVVNPKPIDAWQANLVHYFVFALRPVESTAATAPAPFALFSMTWDYDGPVLALVITPDAMHKQAEIVNLHAPEIVQSVSLTEL